MNNVCSEPLIRHKEQETYPEIWVDSSPMSLATDGPGPDLGERSE